MAAYTEGEFTATLVGVVETVTAVVQWIKFEKIVYLTIPAMAGISNSVGMYLSGIPAELTPATLVYTASPSGVAFINAGSSAVGYVCAYVTTTNRLYFELNTTNSWTIGGQKGIQFPINLNYNLY